MTLGLLIKDNNQELYEFVFIFVIALLGAIAYTEPPFILKYRGFGDILIGMEFGPILVRLTKIIISDETPNFYILSLVCASMTWGILHLNNIRDYDADAKQSVINSVQIFGKQIF